MSVTPPPGGAAGTVSASLGGSSSPLAGPPFTTTLPNFRSWVVSPATRVTTRFGSLTRFAPTAASWYSDSSVSVSASPSTALSASVWTRESSPVAASKASATCAPSAVENVTSWWRLPSIVSSPRLRSVSARSNAVSSSTTGSRRRLLREAVSAPAVIGVEILLIRL